MSSARLRAASLLVASCLAAPAAAAPAAPRAASRARPAVKPLAETLAGEARTAYEGGRKLFEVGDFAGALVKFKTAHGLQSDPRLLWNMAACEKNLRRYRRVRTLAQQYLLDGETAGVLTAADREQARSLLETLREFIGAMRIEVSEPGAAIAVDGEAVGVSPLAQEVEVDIGTRVVTISKDGFRPLSISREVTGGRPLEVRATLERMVSTLNVTTEEDATIFVDGQPVGRGRWRGETKPGRVLLRVTADGKRPHQTELTLEDRETRNLSVALEREAGPRRWLWWAVGGAAAVSGAAVGSYFLLQPRNGPVTPGTIDTVDLPLTGAR